jgi:hypothetical protein
MGREDVGMMVFSAAEIRLVRRINHAILLTIELDSFSPVAWNKFNGFTKHEQCDFLGKTCGKIWESSSCPTK